MWVIRPVWGHEITGQRPPCNGDVTVDPSPPNRPKDYFDSEKDRIEERMPESRPKSEDRKEFSDIKVWRRFKQVSVALAAMKYGAIPSPEASKFDQEGYGS